MIKLLLSSVFIILSINVYAQDDDNENNLLKEAYRLQQVSKRDSAIIVFQKAAQEFQEAGNWQKYIECLAGINRNFLKTDQINNVAENGLKAIEIIDDGKANENDEYIIEILTQLSRYHWYAKGDFPESIKYLDRAIAICDEVEFDVSKRKVQIFTEYGYTYGYSGDFDHSEKYFKDALDLALEIYGPTSETIADRYTDMVFPLIQKSEWEKAETALKKATELNIKLRGPEHISVMKNYNNLGYIYLEKFDNDQAILYINRAIDMIRDRFGENHRSIGIGYMNLGASYHNKNEYRNSITYSLKAYDNFKISIGEKNPYMGIVLGNLANAYNYLDYKDSAQYYYQKTLNLKVELYGIKHPEIINTYTGMSEFFIKNQMYEDAHEALEKAIGISDEILRVKHEYNASIHLQMSNYYYEIGEYDESLKEIQLALISLVTDFDDRSLEVNPVLNDNIISTRILIDALMHKTKLLKTVSLNKNDSELLDIASETALITSQAIDLLRVEYQTPAAKELLITKSKDFFEDAIDITLLLFEETQKEHYLDLAFQHMEKSKSILLIENVRSRNKLAFNNLPDSISNEEKSLSRSIALVKGQLFEAQNQGDSTNLDHLEKEFFQKKLDYDLLLNFIEENYPEYFSFQHSIFNTSISAIQNFLAEKEMLISYFYGKCNLYVIGVSQEDVKHSILNLDGDLQSSIATLVQSFEKRTFDPELSRLVFEQILQPVLKDPLVINSVILLPDGVLHYLPFESLIVSSESDTRNQYLIQDYTVYYMHSTSLPEVEEGSSGSELAYIGFSPSYSVNSNPLLASRSARDIQIASQLEKLPMAEKEIETSASLLGGEYLVDQDATEENFKRMAKNANIIHIASHTIIDDEEPMNSKLVFSPGADSIEDGLLHTYELYNMQLNAELACLSACNTGFGKIKSGEGVVSLAKGFFYAGVPNVMMSLWSVPDVSTSEIMTSFYKELKRGVGKADALRNAKLSYLAQADQNTSDPYYWAAFTMIGDNQSVKIGHAIQTWIWIIAAISIVGMAYAIQKTRHT